MAAVIYFDMSLKAGGTFGEMIMDWCDYAADGEKHVESLAVNEEKGWTARQIWGFAIVDGKRYYTRRVVVSKGSEVLKVRLVYNWQGKK